MPPHVCSAPAVPSTAAGLGTGRQRVPTRAAGTGGGFDSCEVLLQPGVPGAGTADRPLPGPVPVPSHPPAQDRPPPVPVPSPQTGDKLPPARRGRGAGIAPAVPGQAPRTRPPGMPAGEGGGSPRAREPRGGGGRRPGGRCWAHGGRHGAGLGTQRGPREWPPRGGRPRGRGPGRHGNPPGRGRPRRAALTSGRPHLPLSE